MPLSSNPEYHTTDTILATSATQSLAGKRQNYRIDNHRCASQRRQIILYIRAVNHKTKNLHFEHVMIQFIYKIPKTQLYRRAQCCARCCAVSICPLQNTRKPSSMTACAFSSTLFDGNVNQNRGRGRCYIKRGHHSVTVPLPESLVPRNGILIAAWSNKTSFATRQWVHEWSLPMRGHYGQDLLGRALEIRISTQ